MVSTAVYDMGLLLIALTVNYFTFINACVLATYIKIMSQSSGGVTCLGMQYYGSRSFKTVEPPQTHPKLPQSSI